MLTGFLGGGVFGSRPKLVCRGFFTREKPKKLFFFPKPLDDDDRLDLEEEIGPASASPVLSADKI